MKKVMALLLAAVMCFGMLAGCGKKDDGSSGSGSASGEKKKIAFVSEKVGTMASVSYTHLDVYKRQVQRCIWFWILHYGKPYPCHSDHLLRNGYSICLESWLHQHRC